MTCTRVPPRQDPPPSWNHNMGPSDVPWPPCAHPHRASSEWVVGGFDTVGCGVHRGTSLIRNCPPPWDHHRTLGIWSCGRVLGGAFSYGRGSPVGCDCRNQHAGECWGERDQFRGTSLTRDRSPLGPYNRPLSRALWCS